MQLRDARLGHAEHLADLAQGQLLVVVERDDELLPLGQPGDRLAERLLELRLGERRLRLRPLGVLDRVDQGDLVAAGRRDRPELVERARSTSARSRSGCRRAPRPSIPSLPAISSSVGARCSFASSSAIARSISPRPRPHRSRHPVHRAQLVDDRALDPRDRERLELDVAIGVVALDRADQARAARTRRGRPRPRARAARCRAARRRT